MSLSVWLDELTQTLSPHFKPMILQRDHTVFQFFFDTGKPFYLEIKPDAFAFRQSIAESPTLVLYLDKHDTCKVLLEGSEDGMAAFMDGRYRADGNIVLSQLLLYTFKSDRPTIAYEVKD